ncbi:MAG TPA: 50S ribosomal protein L29 [Anaerolineae bacterium]|nr:50S ribosomal protein L29 [Anaerolineae bacterium]HOR00951.1 50S ribosomal protein L29 [Anaerolineae bacterium]HPL28727.1 50S ribosomal protein L29 [Anaerolineae bacterium]
MKAAEMRQMTADELRHRLDETYQELFNLRFQLATKQLADTSRMRQVRRDIARFKALLRERAREEAGQG